METLRLAFLASHEGTTMQAVLDACRDGRLRGIEPVLLICNNSDAGAIVRADAAGLPWLHISAKTHEDPDRAIAGALRESGAGLVLLAGYMKILGPHTLAAFGGRVINTHPGPLPAFGGVGMYGMRVHEAVIAAGVPVSAATIHVVDPEYDHGPILAQRDVPVAPGDTAESLSERVRAAEKELLIETLAGIRDGSITLGAAAG